MQKNGYESHVIETYVLRKVGSSGTWCACKANRKKGKKGLPIWKKIAIDQLSLKKDLRIEKHTGQQVCILICLQASDNG